MKVSCVLQEEEQMEKEKEQYYHHQIRGLWQKISTELGFSALERNVWQAQASVSVDGATWTTSKHKRDSGLFLSMGEAQDWIQLQQ